MIVLNSLFPVFVLIAVGILLKRYGLTNSEFLSKSDRLVYYIFFPVLLFWKIGAASYSSGIQWNFYLVTLLVIFCVFGLSTLAIKLMGISDFQAGSFSQSCYRFNTYIGVAVILNSLGEEGITAFGILLGLAIPMINVFAVSTLIWFSKKDLSAGDRATILVKALAANPLILGCLAGILYSRTVGAFPVFIDNSLRLMSMVTLPMALLSIGGSLSFTGVKKHISVSTIAALMKLVLLPAIGYGAYRFFGINGIHMKVGMIFFCLPASTAIYVLSSQMNSDTELASSAIVLSTVLSFVSLSVALLL